MRLWTIQPVELYKRLQKDKIIHCDSALSEHLGENSFGFDFAFDWLAEQMTKRIGDPPVGVQYPVWAWYALDGKNKKPDLRRTEFRHHTEDHVCLEIEIPDVHVLLSDEETWHIILNNGYFCAANDDAGIDAEYEWFDALPESEKYQVKLQSWDRLFDLDADYNPARFVQATFWELLLDQVKSVRYFKGRRKR